MSSLIGPLTNNIVKSLNKQLQSKKIKTIMKKNFINPIIKYIIEIYYPYFITLTSLFIFFIIILILIFIFNIIIYKKLC